MMIDDNCHPIGDQTETLLMKMIPTIDTHRLTLRPFTSEDAAAVTCLAGDRAIAEMTLVIPHPYPPGLAQEWIATHAGEFAQDRGMTLAIARKPDGILVGAVSLIGLVPGHQAELGYWIGKPHWNDGFCTEAVRAVVRYAFTVLGLLRIHACHFSRNPASGRVMRKIGMTHEGCRRHHVKKWDRFEDLELYGLLKSEWETDRKG